jgi:hypothetical protein
MLCLQMALQNSLASVWAAATRVAGSALTNSRAPLGLLGPIWAKGLPLMLALQISDF